MMAAPQASVRDQSDQPNFWRQRAGYRRTFVQANGPFPHPCHFCGEEVDGHTKPYDGTAAVIHHLDHNRSNNDAANLVPAHRDCHIEHHRAKHHITIVMRKLDDVLPDGRTVRESVQAILDRAAERILEEELARDAAAAPVAPKEAA